MSAPVARILGVVSCLLVWNIAPGPAAPRLARASGDVPVDAYGRPLADSLGAIDYREQDGAWVARHADGSLSPAPTTVSPQAVPANPGAVSGYGLGAYVAHAVGSWPEAVAIGDVTGDGRADVVLTTTFYFDALNDYCVFVFPQQPDGSLGTPMRFPYLATANRNGIALVDLNEDGVLDVVVGHDTGITVLLADGHGSLEPGVVTADLDANTLSATDVDRDGHADIISLGWSRGATIFYGDGHGGFSHKRALATNASGYNDHEVGDLNGDGIPDLAVMSGQLYATPNLTVHRHNGVSDFLSPPDAFFMGAGQLTSGIGLGDVTGDRLNDAVLSGWGNKPTELWIMRQDVTGHLTGPTPISTYDIPEPVEVTDMDRDGREDIAVAHGGWLALGVYLQQTGGGLGSEALYTIPYASHYSPQGLAVGDFTGDGCPDVAIADYNQGLVTLKGMNCTTPTATQVSLVSASAEPGSVELAWSAPAGDVARATVYRRAAGDPWQAVTEISPDGTRMLLYHDTNVVAGARYGYKLGVMGAVGEVFVGEAWVDVPARFALSLTGFRTNPMPAGDVWATFSLPDDAPAELELFDTAGRRVAARDVGALGAGSHVLRLADARVLAPGSYVLRLSAGERKLTARGVVVK